MSKFVKHFSLIIYSKIFKYKSICKINLSDIDFSLIKDMIKFSIPLTASSSSNWLLSGLTQTIIVIMLDPLYNGYYTVATRFSSILILVISVIQFAWNEMAYDINNDSNKVKINNMKKNGKNHNYDRDQQIYDALGS